MQTRPRHKPRGKTNPPQATWKNHDTQATWKNHDIDLLHIDMRGLITI